MSRTGDMYVSVVSSTCNVVCVVCMYVIWMGMWCVVGVECVCVCVCVCVVFDICGCGWCLCV